MNKQNAVNLAWKSPALTRYVDLKGWHGEDYGPVTWEELSSLRRNSVILFNSELYPNKISEWTLRTDPSREIKYYICVLCRRLQDKGRREVPPVHFGTAARIVVRDGRFLVHPDYPTTPHICGFEENPMSDRAAVLARRAMIRARTEISEDGMTPEEKIDEILSRFRSDPKYAGLSTEDLSRIETLIRGRSNCHTFGTSTVARSLLASRRKLISENGTPRKIYECPIVGCSFITCVTAMIDVHISERHKTADGEAQQPSLSEGIFDDCNEFGFVRFDHDPGTQSRSALILFKSRRYPNKISQWAQNGPQGDASTRYTCVLCRRLKEKNRRRNPPVECGPPAAIVVRGGRFMVDPDYPNPPHICDFANNQLADQNEVIGRRSSAVRNVDVKARHKMKKKVMGGGMFFVGKDTDRNSEESFQAREESKPASRYSSPSCCFSIDKHELLDDDGIDPIAEDQPVRSNIRRVPLKRSVAESAIGKLRSGYQCSIVGCSFVTDDIKQLEAHFCDHESLDVGDSAHQMHEVILTSAGETVSGTESLEAGSSTNENDSYSSVQTLSSVSLEDQSMPTRSSNSGEIDYGPVVYEVVSNYNRNSIILFNSIRFPGRVSEWIEKCPYGNNDVKSYICVLCRKVKDRGNQMKASRKYPPSARITVKQGRFLVHPDYPLTPHICDFEANPLSLGESVLKRRPYLRERTNADDGEKLSRIKNENSNEGIVKKVEEENVEFVGCNVETLAVEDIGENVVIDSQGVVRGDYGQLTDSLSDRSDRERLSAHCDRHFEPPQKRAKLLRQQGRHLQLHSINGFATGESVYSDGELNLDEDERTIEGLQADIRDLLKRLNDAIPLLSRVQLRHTLRTLMNFMHSEVPLQPIVEGCESLSNQGFAEEEKIAVTESMKREPDEAEVELLEQPSE
uniref:C2H2-type domain-containing protein n=1 Tax=Parascaris univalens TaxID=6257 RepID=A0A915BZ37_PARUN